MICSSDLLHHSLEAKTPSLSFCCILRFSRVISGLVPALAMQGLVS